MSTIIDRPLTQVEFEIYSAIIDRLQMAADNNGMVHMDAVAEAVYQELQK